MGSLESSCHCLIVPSYWSLVGSLRSRFRVLGDKADAPMRRERAKGRFTCDKTHKTAFAGRHYRAPGKPLPPQNNKNRFCSTERGRLYRAKKAQIKPRALTGIEDEDTRGTRSARGHKSLSYRGGWQPGANCSIFAEDLTRGPVLDRQTSATVQPGYPAHSLR